MIAFCPEPKSKSNKEQLEQLKNYKIEYEGKDEVFRDMFIFSVYAGGLRFSDVVTLKWENFNAKENRITKTIRKTGRYCRILFVLISLLNLHKTLFLYRFHFCK